MYGNEFFMPGSQQEIDNLTVALENGHETVRRIRLIGFWSASDTGVV